MMSIFFCVALDIIIYPAALTPLGATPQTPFLITIEFFQQKSNPPLTVNSVTADNLILKRIFQSYSVKIQCPAVYLICSVIEQIFYFRTAVSLVQVEIRHCCGKACIGNIGNDAGCSIPYILSVGNSVGIFVQLAVYILVECGFVRKVLIERAVKIFFREILLGIGFKRGESIINAFYGRVAKAVIICYRCGIVYRQAATVIDSVKLVRYGHIQLYGFFGGFFGQCGRFIFRRYRRTAFLL